MVFLWLDFWWFGDFIIADPGTGVKGWFGGHARRLWQTLQFTPVQKAGQLRTVMPGIQICKSIFSWGLTYL